MENELYVEWYTQSTDGKKVIDYKRIKGITEKDISLNERVIRFGNQLVVNLDLFIFYEFKQI